MPLYKRIEVSNFTRVFVWKIEESLTDLLSDIQLTQDSESRIYSMRSEIHQKGHASVRQLLKVAGYSDTDLIYDGFGKPHLVDGNFISISHSFSFSGIIISAEKPVGIDIEKQRDKIVNIAHKFTSLEDYKNITNRHTLISKLTIVWGAKESLYKIYGKKKLLFLHHIHIRDFEITAGQTIGEICYEETISTHIIYFLEFEGYVCVYALNK